jgi:hypothetical protein
MAHLHLSLRRALVQVRQLALLLVQHLLLLLSARALPVVVIRHQNQYQLVVERKLEAVEVALLLHLPHRELLIVMVVAVDQAVLCWLLLHLCRVLKAAAVAKE